MLSPDQRDYNIDTNIGMREAKASSAFYGHNPDIKRYFFLTRRALHVQLPERLLAEYQKR